jgi:WhiB family redox-sensing transcriptional regulator
METMRTPPLPSDLFALDLDERPWAAYAACRDAEPELFFSTSEVDTASAIRICQGCPVIEECLDWALDTRVRYGVWGGTTERERRRMLRKTA